MIFRRGEFKPEDLVLIQLPVRPVVIKSGGPIMNVVCVEGDNVLCEWDNDGKKEQGLIGAACLYACVPFELEDEK